MTQRRSIPRIHRAALVAPLLVLALPIVDTLIAITRRGLRVLPTFRADQRHIHHYLIFIGRKQGGTLTLQPKALTAAAASNV